VLSTISDIYNNFPKRLSANVLAAPAAPFGLYSMLDQGLSGLAGLGYLGTENKQTVDQTGHLIPGGEAAGDIAEKVNTLAHHAFNIEPAQTEGEQLQEIVANAITPSPSLPGKLGLLAPLIPGGQARTLAGRAAEVAIPAAFTDAARAAAGQSSVTGSALESA
jgi:hypothetical protein